MTKPKQHNILRSRAKILFLTALGALLPLANALAQTKAADHPLNPLGDTSGGAPEIYGRILRFLLGFAGVGALAFFILGGIILLTSQGNADKVKSGKDTIVWAIIGLLVAFSSYILLRFLLETIVTPGS